MEVADAPGVGDRHSTRAVRNRSACGTRSERFREGGIEELRLENRRLALIDIRGRRIAPHDGVTVWKLSDGPLGLPCEMLFERVAYTVAELSALGFDGGFEARQYRVIENDSGRDVPLRLTVGRSRILVVLDKRRADDDVPTA